MNGVCELLSLLMDIEMSLRRLELWQQQSPPPGALLSTQPFCIDTLSFPQWLQFILLPRMRTLVEAGQRTPGPSQIGPMAEEYFKSTGLTAQSLVDSIYCLDQRLSRP